MDINEFISKHNLPSKDSLEKELGVLDFEESDDIINELIKSLREKINKYIHFLEDVLQPDSSLISLQESSTLSEQDRDDLFSLFKKVVLIQRTHLLVDLDGSNDDKIAYFKQLFAGWHDIKIQLRPFVQKTLSVWGDSVSFEEMKQNYFG